MVTPATCQGSAKNQTIDHGTDGLCQKHAGAFAVELKNCTKEFARALSIFDFHCEH